MPMDATATSPSSPAHPDLLRTGAKVLQDHFPLTLGNVRRFLFLLVVDLRRHREEPGGVKLVELTKDDIVASFEGAAHFVLRLVPPGAEVEGHYCPVGPRGFR